MFFFLAVELLPTAITWRNSPRDRSQRFDEGLGILGGGLGGGIGTTNIPSWLFWPACLPWDHYQGGWISTIFWKKNRITLSLLLLFSKHIKVEAWCAKRKQQSGVCGDDDYEYVQLQVPLRVVRLFFWLRIRDREIKDRKEVVYPAPSLTRDGDAIC